MNINSNKLNLFCYAIIIFICLSLGIYVTLNLDIDTIIGSVEQLPYPIKASALIGMIALQVFLAFLPGEPLELASGYLFGAWQGTLICLIGSAIGTVLVYVIVRQLRRRVIYAMFSKEKVDGVCRIIESKQSMLALFLFFLLPGTPKDIMTYVGSLGNIKLIQWVMITSVGRIPSIITSTFLSDYLKQGNMVMACIVFVITIVLCAIGMIYYKHMNEGKE